MCDCDFRGVRKEKGGFIIFSMVCLALETGSTSILTRFALDSYIVLAFKVFEFDFNHGVAGCCGN